MAASGRGDADGSGRNDSDDISGLMNRSCLAMKDTLEGSVNER